MKHIIDFDYNEDGEQIAAHVFHTDVAPWNKIAHPDGSGKMIDAIQFIQLAHKDKKIAQKAGFLDIAKHPHHPGKTRLDVLRDEMIRKDDPHREVLGI